MNGSLLCPLLYYNPSRRWSGRPIDARGRCFMDFLRFRNRLVAGLPFPPLLTRIAWIGLSRNRFLRVPSGVTASEDFFGSIHEAAALKFPRPDGRGRRLKSGEIPAHGGQFPVRRSKFPARLNKFPVRHELIPCFIL